MAQIMARNSIKINFSSIFKNKFFLPRTIPENLEFKIFMVIIALETIFSLNILLI